MPTPEQILAGLRDVANNATWLAIAWHVFFGAIAIALLLKARPSRRLAGLLISLPLISVAAVAATIPNPFNAGMFGLIGLLSAVFAFRLPCRRVRIAPMGLLIPGLMLFAFGWFYPHFLESKPAATYLFAAPTGLIPCPTLSIALGLFLVLNGLGSRALAWLYGLAGLFYGLFGVLRLGVTLDLGLLAGALIVTVAALGGRFKRDA
jgi:hypothetical protein